MWILIIAMIGGGSAGYSGSGITSVAGFTSAERCLRAGEIMAQAVTGRAVVYRCARANLHPSR